MAPHLVIFDCDGTPVAATVIRLETSGAHEIVADFDQLLRAIRRRTGDQAA